MFWFELTMLHEFAKFVAEPIESSLNSFPTTTLTHLVVDVGS